MRKVLILVIAFCVLEACNPSNNNPGESGAVNDGMKAVDTNGAFDESAPNENASPNRATDTAQGENRVDIQSRDTAHLNH